MKNWKVGLGCLIVIVGTFFCFERSSQAQIIPDDTLRNEGSIITPNLELGRDLIEGGAVRDSHLFHSFSEFNINAFQEVYFANPIGIENILTRITGNNISEILGTLGVEGNASLYFLNPNGIMFGENAQLNITGSFVATTADSIIFNNNFAFSASNPLSPPLLTLNLTPGIQYGAISPAEISSRGVLRVGGNLTLTAGNLNLEDSLETGGNLTLEATDTVKIREGFVSTTLLQENTGTVNINAGEKITLTNSFIDTGTFQEEGIAGDIILQAATSNPEEVAIQLINTELNAASFGERGRSGNITIEAVNSGAIEFIGEGNITPRIFTDTFASDENAAGKKTGGDITVIGGNITINNYAFDASVNEGSVGNGGSIFINGNSILIENRSEIATTAREGVFGNSGDIEIIGNSIILQDNALINATNAGFGQGGSISLQGESVTLNNSGLITAVYESRREMATGTGGDIYITAGNIELRDRTSLDASLEGGGEGGDIVLEALSGERNIKIEDSLISTTAEIGSRGNGGDVFLMATTLDIMDFSAINAENLGAGLGGSIFVQSLDSGSVSLSGSSTLSTAVQSGGTGNGGNIEISGGVVSLTEGSRLQAQTWGQGNAGNIIILDSDRVTVQGESPFGQTSAFLASSERPNSGEGGNIIIGSSSQPVGVLQVADRAVLSARTRGSAAGGNIEVNVNQLEVLNGGQLSTSSFSTGAAGNMIVNATESIFISGNNPNVTNIEEQIPSNGTGIVNEVEPNNSLTQAQLISFEAFTLTENPNVPLSGIVPYVSILGTGDNTFDYYSVEVTSQGSQGIFDIDTGELGGLDGIDTHIFIVDSNSSLIAENDQSSPNSGGEGSLSDFDSFINVTFPKPDTYTVIVTEFVDPFTTETGVEDIAGNIQAQPIGLGKDYTLNISLDNRTINPNQGISSALLAQGLSSGDAGNIIINTPNFTVADNGAITASTNSGISGNIQLQDLNSLDVNNGRISVSTQSGQAGNLNIDTTHSIQLTGANSGLFALAAREGSAGTLIINTGVLTITEGAQATVSNPEGQAGNLEVTANTLVLEQGQLQAETGGGQEGAIITLQLSDQLNMSNESLLSANAFGTADGGNINLNARFIIAFPPTGDRGSDIVANAVEGNGGRIDIISEGLFGILSRESPTHFNDITASSEFGLAGDVLIQDPHVDPSQGLVELPTEVVDVGTLVTQTCSADRDNIANLSEFIITGRGGLPPNPNEPLIQQDPLVDWVSLPVSLDSLSTTYELQQVSPPSSHTSQEIIEAQGWIVSSQGQVILTPQPTLITPQASQSYTATCQIENYSV